MADIGIKRKAVPTSICNKEEADKEPVAEIPLVQEHRVPCQKYEFGSFGRRHFCLFLGKEYDALS